MTGVNAFGVHPAGAVGSRHAAHAASAAAHARIAAATDPSVDGGIT